MIGEILQVIMAVLTGKADKGNEQIPQEQSMKPTASKFPKYNLWLAIVGLIIQTFLVRSPTTIQDWIKTLGIADFDSSRINSILAEFFFPELAIILFTLISGIVIVFRAAGKDRHAQKLGWYAVCVTLFNILIFVISIGNGA